MTAAAATILNVEDTEAARYTKNRTLRHAGFNVIDAQTGAEALAVMESSRPQLAVLDVHLPDMSGLDVCKAIKARWPSTMVLQTSATYITSTDRTRGLDVGADYYLIEPSDPHELVAAARALLRLQAAENALRNLNETLEAKIEERTLDLRRANIQLVEQIAQRERAETALVQTQKLETVGQLSDSMAHDFKNILASVTGYVRIAREKTTDPEAQRLLDEAIAAADRGKRLTARFLAFSRANAIAPARVDVCSAVLEMQEWLKQTAGKSIKLEAHLPGAPLGAVTDANQFELALLNLVMNARDALPAGGSILIEVTSRELTEPDGDLAPGRYIVVTVTDDGIGMPREVSAQAFEPFFTTKLPPLGTGLGLSQVLTLARLSQGTARISSREGKGTSVSLWLAAARG